MEKSLANPIKILTFCIWPINLATQTLMAVRIIADLLFFYGDCTFRRAAKAILTSLNTPKISANLTSIALH